MEINIKTLLKDTDYMNINDDIIISTEKNSIIFGSNGIGKTTIYHEIKNQYKEFDFLDYEETKDMFKKNKKKIELSLEINKLEELSQKIEEYNNILSIQPKLKNKGITSKTKAKDVSEKLAERYNEKYFSSINIQKDDFKAIDSVKPYVKYIVSNYKDLLSINDIEEELKLVDQNYLRKVLSMLEPKISETTKICPVCGSKVNNLKDIIEEKLLSFSKIKNKCLNAFIKEFSYELENKTVKDEFKQILDTVRNIDENKFIDYYIIDGNQEEKNKINIAFQEVQVTKKDYDKCLKKQEYLFDSLISQKELYTDYLKRNFGANVKFNKNDKIVTITFGRNVDTFSTGEINIILFITKLFGFLGSEKNFLIIDDPISSYDLVNQYHIVFHLCKIVSSNKKHVVIFTHNPDVINVINSQNSRTYDYKFFDKINGNIVMIEFLNDKKHAGNVLCVDDLIEDKNIEANKYISLLAVRNDEDANDYLSTVLHYDGKLRILDQTAGEYEGCTNKFLIDYIENDIYIDDLKDTSFDNLCRTKILILTAIRVWIEYKLYKISKVPLKSNNIGISEVISDFFKKNTNIKQLYPNLSREKLMNKKVMLNQNCHVRSQVQPFYYALSVKTDDIINDIKELKLVFEETK